MQPEITIIIPVYNSAEYIVPCLESLSQQSFTNFEAFIINDNSTDDSDCIIQNFLSATPGFSYEYSTNQENKGWCLIRNEGISRARGKYICFLDSDDTYHRDYLKMLYEKITLTNSDFVFCGYDRVFANTNKKKPYTDSWKYPNADNITRLKYDYMLGKTHICHCAAIYNKLFLMQNNLFYNPDCRRSGDTEFIIRILFCCKKFSVVQKSLYNYTIRPNSISTQYPTVKSFESYYAYERIKKDIHNPFWRILFTITKEARRICSLLNEFISHNEPLPYLFCPKYKLLGYLFINLLIKRNALAYQTLKDFWKQYIKSKIK